MDTLEINTKGDSLPSNYKVSVCNIFNDIPYFIFYQDDTSIMVSIKTMDILNNNYTWNNLSTEKDILHKWLFDTYYLDDTKRNYEAIIVAWNILNPMNKVYNQFKNPWLNKKG
jgi:hypothetical protein